MAVTTPETGTARHRSRRGVPGARPAGHAGRRPRL